MRVWIVWSRMQEYETEDEIVGVFASIEAADACAKAERKKDPCSMRREGRWVYVGKHQTRWEDDPSGKLVCQGGHNHFRVTRHTVEP